MAKLGTVEWWQCLADMLNDNEEFREDAQDFSFYFIFVVDDDRKTVMNFENGVVTDVHAVVPGDEEKATIIAEGLPATWADLQAGKLRAELGLMTGKIKITKGSKTALIKQLGPASDIFTTMKKIPTEV